jgi:SseB protein C-terminal domain
VRQPTSYPAPLLEALWVHFQHGGKVNEAYLAELLDGGASPQLAVGVRVSRLDLVESVLAAAGDVARGAYSGEVRFLRLNGDQLSRRVIEEGVCFFSRRPSPEEHSAAAPSPSGSWYLLEPASSRR